MADVRNEPHGEAKHSTGSSPDGPQDIDTPMNTSAYTADPLHVALQMARVSYILRLPLDIHAARRILTTRLSGITTKQWEWAVSVTGAGIDRKGLGVLLRQARLSLGLSQAKLAKTVGVSPVFISQLETGQRVPSDRVAKRVAITLDLPWQEVLRAVYALRSREAGELFAESDVQREPRWRSVVDVPSLRLLLLQLASLKLPPSDIERLVANWTNDVQFLKAQLNRVHKRMS